MEPEILQTQKERDLPNLQSLIDAGQLNQWIVQLISPYIKGKVLEIWGGEGNMSALLVQNRLPLRISDPHRHNCELLQKRFESEAIIKRIHRINLYDPEFDVNYDNFLGKFDTVLSLNTTEPGAINPAILKNAKKLLQQRGRLIVLLPARTVLYEESDEGYRELRRYNRKNIKDVLGVESKILEFFSVSEIPHCRQVPFFRVSEQPPSYRTGLHIIVSARK
jgi:hypothetical protein